MKRSSLGAAVVGTMLFVQLPASTARAAPPVQPAPPSSAPAPAPSPSTGSDSASDPKREEARQRYQRGLQLFNEANYEAARVEFERAYQLAPSYKILYNVGLCYEQLGDYVQAQSTLRNYLEIGGAEISEERRSEVTNELAQIRPRIARVTIHTNVAGAEALVDDQCSTDVTTGAANCAPFAKESRVVLMNPGRRRVLLRKEGYLPETAVITVAGSDQAEITINLRPLPKPGERKESNPFVTPTLVAGGVTVAGLTATIILGVLTSNASSDQDDSLARFGTTNTQLTDGRSKVRELGTFTTGFAIGTTAALAVTTYFAIRSLTWKRPVGPATGGIRVNERGIIEF